MKVRHHFYRITQRLDDFLLDPEGRFRDARDLQLGEFQAEGSFRSSIEVTSCKDKAGGGSTRCKGNAFSNG